MRQKENQAISTGGVFPEVEGWGIIVPIPNLFYYFNDRHGHQQWEQMWKKQWDQEYPGYP